MKEINSTTKAVPLTISYDTITLRKFRIWIHIQAVIYSLKHFGKSVSVFHFSCFIAGINSTSDRLCFLHAVICCWSHHLTEIFNIFLICVPFQDFLSRTLMKSKPCLLKLVFTFWLCPSWCLHSMWDCFCFKNLAIIL